MSRNGDNHNDGENIVLEAVSITATWGYKIPNTHCSICKNPLTMAPTDLEQKGTTKYLTDTPLIVKGKCDHCFHKHCMDMWKNSSCPLDNTDFSVEWHNGDDDKWIERMPKKFD